MRRILFLILKNERKTRKKMNSFKMLNYLKKGDKLYFDISPEEQLAFLNSLKEPKDDFDRSYKQYKCQRFLSTTAKGILFNCGSLIILPFFILFYFIKGFRRPKVQHVDAAGEFKGMTEIIPDSLNKEFSINNDIWFEGAELRMHDIGFIISLIVRYFYAPYFLIKAIAKVARYSFTITRRTPRAIVVHDEYSYTSSLLTNYCEQRNVLHIDVMHGEKLVYIGNSFFRYHRCYIWGEHYRALFHDLRAADDQFIIEIPQCFKIDLEKEYRAEYYSDYKYYLQGYDEKKLKRIIESMGFAKQKGASVVYRPHPRFSDLALLNKYLKPEQIEDPHKVPIVNSIASTKVAVGSYSTVLNQAYFSGRDILFDDVTDADTYQKLKGLRYIFSSMDDKRLSLESAKIDN